MDGTGWIWLVLLAVAFLVLGGVLRLLWGGAEDGTGDGVDAGEQAWDRSRDSHSARDAGLAAMEDESHPPPQPMPTGDDVPYRVDLRPMPSGEDPAMLLPVQVGPFVREPLSAPGDVLNEPIYANYRGGTADVFFELGICRDARQAQQGLMTAKRETDAEFGDEPQVFQAGTDPSFLLTSNRLGAFMAWTRGRYYLSAHTRGGQADLDRFMEAFPY